MLRSARELRGYRVRATDGDIGRVADVYFDDSAWTVRYLVVDTGGWLSGRQVLVSPASCRAPDAAARILPVALGRQQVQSSPPAEADLPVSRQQEIELAAYYGWPDYWVGEPVYGAGGVGWAPAAVARTPAALTGGDPHLRSAREVTGYHIQATDGEIGHVMDFLVEDETWVIRYLVVDTRNWLPGRKVLLAPEWVRHVSWAEMKVLADVSRERMRHAPAFDPAAGLTREAEQRLYEYYGRRKYWEG